MPNGLAPSYSLSCYLSRPVVWGESARGPTPHQRDLAGGRGPFSWCLGWSVGEPSELGAGASAVG